MNVINGLKIGFIGAGRVGVTLGSYFKGKGYRLAGYTSKSLQSAEAAAYITSAEAFSSASELAQKCDMIFITTPDREVENVWSKLRSCDIKGRIVCHTSGSMTSDIFYGINECEAFGYSIHPMYAFSQKNGKTGRLDTAHFTIEGDKERLEEVKAFICSLGNRAAVIDAGFKAQYHLANVAASNLVLALLGMACECMSSCGMDEDSALLALMPLVFGNIENISHNGLAGALTGPVERADAATLARHLEVLPGRYERVYKELSMKLVDLSKRKNPGKDYSGIIKYLEL